MLQAVVESKGSLHLSDYRVTANTSGAGNLARLRTIACAFNGDTCGRRRYYSTGFCSFGHHGYLELSSRDLLNLKRGADSVAVNAI